MGHALLIGGGIYTAARIAAESSLPFRTAVMGVWVGSLLLALIVGTDDSKKK